jgi:hypothetical protein
VVPPSFSSRSRRRSGTVPVACELHELDVARTERTDDFWRVFLSLAKKAHGPPR